MSDFLLVNFFNHLRTNIDTLLSQLIALRLIIINNKAQYYFSDEKASFYSYTEVLLAWSIKTENPRKGNTLNSMQIFQIFFISIGNMSVFLWRRKWQPIPLFLPGESHTEWSLVGYSSRVHRVGHD